VDIAISRALHVPREVTARRDTTWGDLTAATATNLAWLLQHVISVSAWKTHKAYVARHLVAPQLRERLPNVALQL
jgi:hypothetical protein